MIRLCSQTNSARILVASCVLAVPTAGAAHSDQFLAGPPADTSNESVPAEPAEALSAESVAEAGASAAPAQVESASQQPLETGRSAEEAAVPASELLPLGSSGRSTPASPTKGAGIPMPWWVQTVGALVLVIGLALLLKAGVQKLAGASGTLANQLGAGGKSPSGVVYVLGRYPVSRGHTLVLLQVDQRVILLGQSSAGFRSLCEFTEADEVASILTKTRDEEGASLTARFNEMLRQVEQDPQTLDDATAAPIPEPRVQDDSTGLRAARRRLLGLGGLEA